MILDAIIGLFAAIIASLTGAAMFLFAPVYNIFAVVIEAVVGIFVAGFSMGRVGRNQGKNMKCTPANVRSQLAFVVVVVTVIAAVVAYPRVMNRKITLVAEDGHSLLFAALVVHKGDGDHHIRTDNAGNVVVSRFSTKGITLKDPRYVERTWQNSELSQNLIAQRTLLGSGLDSVANRLLKREP
jgi:hypothetical protein